MITGAKMPALAMALALSLPAMAAPAAKVTPAQPPAARLHQLMARYHALGQLDGAVLVAERGRVIYQGAFGEANREWRQPATVDTAFRIASLSKQFTAAVVLKLVEQGKLRLDDKIGSYVPDLNPAIGGAVTLHQLLNHTSGIVDYANFPGFWNGRLGSVVPRADFLAIMNGPLEFAPGTQGKYNSSGYTLLGYAVEKVTGKPFAQVLDELILAPLHMTRSGFDAPERIVARKASGYMRVLGQYQTAGNVWMPNVMASGGMVSTVGDMLKWDQALYGTRLLSAESKRVMFTPYVKDDVWGDLGFGYGWMIGQRSIGAGSVLVHEHGGNTHGFRSLITRFPGQQRLIVLLLNEGNGNKGRGIYQIRDSFTQLLYGQPTAMPAPPLADAIVDSIQRHGVAATGQRLATLARAAAGPRDANELNMLAYQYAGQGSLDHAVAVLGMNLQLYPNDGNTHDSLGEIELMRGNKAAALRAYRQALALDPANSNAARAIKALESAP